MRIAPIVPIVLTFWPISPRQRGRSRRIQPWRNCGRRSRCGRPVLHVVPLRVQDFAAWRPSHLSWPHPVLIARDVIRPDLPEAVEPEPARLVERAELRTRGVAVQAQVLPAKPPRVAGGPLQQRG